MRYPPDIRIIPNGQDWAVSASELIRQVCDEAIRARGRFLLALSGGSTPKTLYQTWATPDWRPMFDWDRIVFFFGDERCVPPDHPESNFGLAQNALFGPVGIKPANVHRLHGEQADALAAAQDYERQIRTVTNCPAPGFPQLDLVLLGLGDDGHTASLFPGTAALRDQTRLVTVSQSPKGIATRLTLTAGVINRATVVLFLVAGAGKASVVRAVLEPRTDEERALPAAMIRPTSGRLIWMLDQPAAAQLTGGR